MLVHHDSRPYEVAASAVRVRALEIINAKIERGKLNAKNVIETIQTQVPVDMVAPYNKLDFEVAKDGTQLVVMPKGKDPLRLHRHALGQAAERMRIPMAYVDTLTKDGQMELLADNFRERVRKQEGNRFLLRSIGDEVRGFLSDSYRRIDSRPVVDAFIGQLHKLGAMPYEGYVTDTKIAIQAIDMQVYEPIRNEVIAFVYALQTSDFGNGALEFRSSVLRIWCTNLAMGEEMLRKIHLGKRLDDRIEYSQQTYELDSKTVVSALDDTIKYALGEENRVRYLAAIRQAHEEKIDPFKVKDLLQKQLGKEVTAKVIEKFNSPDVELLPPGNTKWRMSNAISWLAGEESDAEKKLDMMKVAGTFLDLEDAKEGVVAAA